MQLTKEIEKQDLPNSRVFILGKRTQTDKILCRNQAEPQAAVIHSNFKLHVWISLHSESQAALIYTNFKLRTWTKLTFRTSGRCDPYQLQTACLDMD
ncbi:hypothetical protein RRG08_066753 [Elysia crispata]|uniref:Uncharacterized protein n=1 Tax=Elysia crispata TaxID=231223 RepID=A0AAE0XPI0_9GAST|nr:hypothetical protein RRG08_066753 [Elysia crispata]